MQLLANLSSACMREPGVQYISAKNTVEAAVRVIATPRGRKTEIEREEERERERDSELLSECVCERERERDKERRRES